MGCCGSKQDPAVAAQKVPPGKPKAAAAHPAFPIGKAGVAWGDAERAEWLKTRQIQRSYADEVVAKIDKLRERFDVEQYGALSHDPARYPLFRAKTKNWADGKPCVLVTGGVHGYETSGVQGALLFLDTKAEQYSEKFNILVAPCVSPWGYETIQRWNAQAVDPNRSFNPDGEVVPGRSFNPEAGTDESKAIIQLLKGLGVEQWTCHIDCHETTDTDESEFRPAKAARDGQEHKPGTIPDGFYLVADETSPQTAWCKSIIDAVREVTHIAPADKGSQTDEHPMGTIIGEKVVQDGVIAIVQPSKLGLCSGVTNATYAVTTEVYPDSKQASAEQCNRAQVAVVCAALDHILAAPAAGAAPPKSCCPPGSHGYLAADHDDKGKEINVGGTQCYVVGDGKTGILIIPDVWGWNGGRTRAIADELAALGAKVVVPKILQPCFEGGTHGDGLPPNFQIHERMSELPLQDWVYAKVGEGLRNALAHLEETSSKVGIIGFCYGTWVGMHLAGQVGDKVVCGVGPHPSVHIEGMMGGEPAALGSASKVPWLLMPAGVVSEAGADPDMYDEDGALFKALEGKHPGKNKTVRFPTQKHGFVPRGDIKDGNYKCGEGGDVKEKVTEAMRLTIDYLRQHGVVPDVAE